MESRRLVTGCCARLRWPTCPQTDIIVIVVIVLFKQMIYKMLNELCILHMRLCRFVPFFILAASPSTSFSPSHSNSRLPLLLSFPISVPVTSPLAVPFRTPIHVRVWVYLCLHLGYGVGFNKLAWGAPAAIVVVVAVVVFHFLLFALGIP